MNLMGRTALFCAISASTFSKFEAIESSDLQSSEIKRAYQLIESQQRQSKNILGNELGRIVAKYDVGDSSPSHLNQLKKFLVKDFYCPKNTSPMQVRLRRREKNQTIAISNAFLGYADESKSYVQSMLKKAIKIRDMDNLLERISLYQVSLSGKGACDYGRDGFILQDKSKREFIFAFSPWGL